MTTVAFDTHKAAQTLTNAGVENKQADAHVEVLMEVTSNLATKDDIKNLSETFDLKLAALESNLTNSLTMRFVGIISLAVVAVKYLP